MKLQTKYSILFIAFFLIFLSGLFFQKKIESKRIALHHEEETEEKIALISIMVDLLSEPLQDWVFDMTFWDELIQFKNNPNPNWAKINIDESLSTFGGDFAFIVDTNHQQIYQFFDANISNSNLYKTIIEQNNIFNFLDKNHFTHFITTIDNIPFEIHGASIHPSNDIDRNTPSQGYLLAGKILDESYLNKISEISSCTLTFKPNLDEPLNTDLINFQLPLKCRKNDSPILLYASYESSQFEEHHLMATEQILFYIAFSFIFIFFIFIFTIHWVLKPLNLISNSLDQNKPELLNKLKNKPSDFGRLALLIDSFFKQKNQLANDLKAHEMTRIKLRDSENKFKSLAENIPGVVYRCLNQPEWPMIYISDEIINFTGYPAKEYINQKIFINTHFHPDDVDMVNQTVENSINKKTPYEIEYRLIDKSQQIHWVYEKGQAIYDTKGQVMYLDGVLLDITDKKTVENALKLSKNQLQSLINHATDIILTIDSHGVILTTNHPIKGFQVQKMIGSNILNFIDKKHHELVRTSIQAIFKGKTPIRFEMLCTEFEQYPTWCSTQLSPIKIDHHIYAATMIIRDMTDLKKAEERLNQMNQELEERVQQRTIELQKMNQELERSNQELEQFAFIASHDLQEPLRMISGFNELLLKKYEKTLEPEACQYIRYSLEGSSRLQIMIEDLLLYSRIHKKTELKLVDCHYILQRVKSNLRLQIQESNVTIHEHNLPQINADTFKIEQLFQNLLSNSIKFKSQLDPIIQIDCKDRFDEWMFIFKDNGIGINLEFQDKIFTIFQRLHSRRDYPGSGIGLSICKKIVEQFGGKIWFESEENKGCTFFFTISKKKDL